VTASASTLPRLLVLTDRTQILAFLRGKTSNTDADFRKNVRNDAEPGARTRLAAEGLVRVVTAAVERGARAVVLREKDLPRAQRAALADELRPIVRDPGGVLIIASDPTIEADGVHLAAADPFPSPDGRPAIVGRSCHSLDDVRAAEAEGCDYVTLSPIFESRSKPGYGPPLGLAQLEHVTSSVSIPVFALGGVDVGDVRPCRAAGAYGVASMGRVGELFVHAVRHELDDCECELRFQFGTATDSGSVSGWSRP
jgi:thiamine-phosphate diphosphorylase